MLDFIMLSILIWLFMAINHCQVIFFSCLISFCRWETLLLMIAMIMLAPLSIGGPMV